LLERQGNFSEVPGVVQYGLYDPLTTKYNSSLGYFTRQPFTNPDGTLATSLPANRLDQSALFFLNSFPTPNFLDPRQQNAAAGGCLNLCNNFEGTYGSRQTTQSGVVKIDHQISSKQKLFVDWLYKLTNYSFGKVPWKGATAPVNGFNGFDPWRVVNQIWGLGYTYAFSPSLLNEFRFSYSRQNNISLPLPNNLFDTSAVNNLLSKLKLPPTGPATSPAGFSVGGVSWGLGQGAAHNVSDAFTLSDNLTKVISRHSLKAGFAFRDDQTGASNGPWEYLNFGGALTDNPATGSGGNPWAQFLLGTADQSSGYAVAFPVYWTNHVWSAYIQDDYRITPKFTLNLGVRYDVYTWYLERHDRARVFDPNQPNPVLPNRLA